MKNIFYILSVFIILASNCPGEDGGRSSFVKYSIVNKSDHEIEMYWHKTFRVSIPQPDTTIRIDTVAISIGEEVILYSATNSLSAPPERGLLRSRPFYNINSIDEYGYPFDSVTVKYIGRSSQTYSADLCKTGSNPLCESDYKVVRSVDNKKDKIREYLFTLE